MRATRLGADEPESWVARAFLETVTGEFEAAARSIDRALDLDPLAPHVLGDVGLLHLWAGRWGDAEASCGRAVRVEPRAVWALGCAFDAALLGGGEARALEWGRRLVARWGDDAAPPASVEEVVRRRAQRATTLTGIDDWSLALLLAASGAPDDAVEALERAARQPHFGVVGIGVDPRFAALRGTPRYERLVARVAPAAVRGNGVLD